MPRLSVFPKCYMYELCATRTMTLLDWIELSAALGVDGVEMYPAFFESFEPQYLGCVRRQLVKHRLDAPMMCASLDFSLAVLLVWSSEIRRRAHHLSIKPEPHQVPTHASYGLRLQVY